MYDVKSNNSLPIPRSQSRKNLYIFYSVFFLSFIALYFTLKSAVIYFELYFCMRCKVEVEVNLFAIKLLKEI